jgi:hypothetical protein
MDSTREEQDRVHQVTGATFSLKDLIAELDSISRQIDALTSRVERAVERLATTG